MTESAKHFWRRPRWSAQSPVAIPTKERCLEQAA